MEKISLGIFSPLNGFMNEKDFYSVSNFMRLSNGKIFPIPVVLSVYEDQYEKVKKYPVIRLFYNEDCVGEISQESVFRPNFPKILPKVFGTKDSNHPGYKMLSNAGNVCIGGAVKLTKRIVHPLSKYEVYPEIIKADIKRRNLKTIAGFQTRNVPHRAHEYLQRLALEKVDGLFIQPLIGRKKIGDFTPEAIMKSYQTLINDFLPQRKILLGALTTSMRYAGPREAVFHALIRKNYGCTHFIVGRDHAGVSGYYGKYDAHKLCKKIESELGIKIIYMRGPFYCDKCGQVVTDRVCNHEKDKPKSTFEISGTKIRAMLKGKEAVSEKYIRPEIVNSLSGVKIFIEEEI